MIGNPAQPLIDFDPTEAFFIGIDSDGCAFDTMEVKHKECFTPNTIKHFGLQAVSKYAREAAGFVNLYSKWRGINRFPALLMVLELLAERREVQKREVVVPRLPALHEWVARGGPASNAGLEVAIRAADSTEAAELQRVLNWSKAVNVAVSETVRNIPPFPFVRQCLGKASGGADIVVVSATPGEALEREWHEHDLAKYAAVIAGQEMGTKAEHLRRATDSKYARDHVLMIGDAPGDLEAAWKNGALFYPINPGFEAESWERLCEEGLDRFFAGTYEGAYAAALIEEFEALLPDTPPWARR
ncbi:MAG: hypothetical protein JSV19_11780 [Phycisphaerales bacterium]|nr:MAG: hypothetical protein JSV19_11780 [Phycisphaerales bacterium]